MTYLNPQGRNARLEELATDGIDNFFKRKLEVLRSFNLRDSLLSCNPYSLVMAGNDNAGKIIENLLKAHQRGYEETSFNEVLVESILRLAFNANAKSTKGLVCRHRSGQPFWTEVTGDPEFYLKLIRLMRDNPTKHRLEYEEAWNASLNKFTRDFSNDFCFPDGRIDWEKLVRFVSEDTEK